MKATGIVRQIDEVGRIVLPVELRSTLGIDKKDSVEIFTEGDTIILRKYQPTCVFCGKTENIKEFKKKLLCVDCIRELTEQFNTENAEADSSFAAEGTGNNG